MHSQLNAFVSSKVFSMKPMSRVVFQGDTMSPIMFLLAFNPVICMAKKLQCPGFFFRIPIENSESLPDSNSHLYVEWDESCSDEAPGWYKCKVSHYLIYTDGSTEEINLKDIPCRCARKSSKKYIPLSLQPPSFIPSDQSNSAKSFSSESINQTFADDLTIITTDFSDHQSTL